MYKLITTIAVLAVASANKIEERPQVESPQVQQNNFPNKGWEISDWFVGLVMGGYGPLVAMARDDDCFSSWYSWGLATIEFARYFDRNFDINSWTNWVGFWITMTIFFFKNWALVANCKEELEYAKESKWHENFGFLADINIPKVPKVMAYSRNSTSFTVWQIIGLILGAMSLYSYWQSEYWFWGLGYAMGGLASSIFVGIDVWGDLGIITPTPAHIRYLEH